VYGQSSLMVLGDTDAYTLGVVWKRSGWGSRLAVGSWELEVMEA
jgi:hypothetical protein